MTADLTSRIQRAQSAMAAAELDALLVAPGPDLRYLTGYDAHPLERLTVLVLPAEGAPVLVVPVLEAPEAERSPAALAGMQLLTHGETDDAHALAVRSISAARRVAGDDHMWAVRMLALRRAWPDAEFDVAGRVISDLRMRKGSDEVASLRQAGAAIDRVHARMGEFLKVGQTERQCGAAIAEAIVDEGHVAVDFVIVGSGPNGASPHHSLSDRVIEAGDSVVIDIGGSTLEGYCSDSTRTYVVGAEAPAEVTEYYDVLLEAQRAQCDYAKPGVSAE